MTDPSPTSRAKSEIGPAIASWMQQEQQRGTSPREIRRTLFSIVGSAFSIAAKGKSAWTEPMKEQLRDVLRDLASRKLPRDELVAEVARRMSISPGAAQRACNKFAREAYLAAKGEPGP
jgi:hypothetical protein